MANAKLGWASAAVAGLIALALRNYGTRIVGEMTREITTALKPDSPDANDIWLFEMPVLRPVR